VDGEKPYLARAAARFLDGLPFRAPVEAVEAGVKSLREWCEVLAAERAAAGLRDTRKRPLSVLRYEGPEAPAPSLLAFLDDVAA
jgi:hypothetical protein